MSLLHVAANEGDDAQPVDAHYSDAEQKGTLGVFFVGWGRGNVGGVLLDVGAQRGSRHRGHREQAGVGLWTCADQDHSGVRGDLNCITNSKLDKIGGNPHKGKAGQAELSNYPMRGREPPYKQHHHLVKCVNQIRKENGVFSEMRGRIFCLFPIHNGKIGSIIEQSIWLLNIILPVIFILVACLCETDTVMCICSVALCVLIACHAITVFLVLHNSKIARRQWFVKKVDLQNYFGRENCILEVTLDIIDTVQFLSASQKSDIIARLARNQVLLIMQNKVLSDGKIAYTDNLGRREPSGARRVR
ncbi:hypothetical protein C0Q70_16030 [Pomacea canaliculata]|uniref:Uncharacterized protein n=1 Tax=Pomacea canaliculata TaxID=400727 RepID=A0A2T7NNN2_POMCA|nr:hypothetical protein C0Q70_16030 [Pomacea canaliculata]